MQNSYNYSKQEDLKHVGMISWTSIFTFFYALYIKIFFCFWSVFSILFPIISILFYLSSLNIIQKSRFRIKKKTKDESRRLKDCKRIITIKRRLYIMHNEIIKDVSCAAGPPLWMESIKSKQNMHHTTILNSWPRNQ